MSEQAHIQTLFAYHWDTTDRLIAGAGKLGAEEQDALQAIFMHLLSVDYAWRTALETGRQPAPLAAADFPTLEAIGAGFAAERRAWGALLDGLSDEEIAATALLTRANGQPSPLPRWRVLHQVLLHGMQHHAELAQLLTAQGQSPGNIDFIFHR
ncbi:MAG: DinB family protein [Chloroflexales bacterium]